MSQTTTNLELVKPELADNITPTIFAENFQKIDDAVGTINEGLSLKLDSATASSTYAKLTDIGTKATMTVNGTTLSITL